MGEIDKKGVYINKVPFSDSPYLDGEFCIRSDNKRVNEYIERQVRQMLRDIYYGRVEGLDI